MMKKKIEGLLWEGVTARSPLPQFFFFSHDVDLAFLMTWWSTKIFVWRGKLIVQYVHMSQYYWVWWSTPSRNLMEMWQREWPDNRLNLKDRFQTLESDLIKKVKPQRLEQYFSQNNKTIPFA